MRLPLLCLLLVALLAPVRAAEPFFKKGDVIALVGGEDMVVASEYGYLELLLTRALPDHHLRFRNLAWEGDTVFEQRRDLNFPTWEEQLDKIGATVVICQFGKLSSLGNHGLMKPVGSSPAEARTELPEFIATYEKLIQRLNAGGQRRVVILTPFFPSTPQHRAISNTLHLVPANNLAARTEDFLAYVNACEQVGMQTTSRVLSVDLAQFEKSPFRNDGFHLSENGHHYAAQAIVTDLLGGPAGRGKIDPSGEKLRQLIIAKNRLWFDYWRPQNWAFLAGDRTAQPSSRDHLDPSKRWFPPEREAFLPLIEAKEKEIDALAAQLAQKP
jgi:hypothetical protein